MYPLLIFAVCGAIMAVVVWRSRPEPGPWDISPAPDTDIDTSVRAAEVDRSAVPALGADRAFQAPTVQAGKLANGLEVFVVERADLPKVAVSLVTRAGAGADPAGKDGVASLTLSTVYERDELGAQQV